MINHLIPVSNLTRASNIFFEERKNRTFVGFTRERKMILREIVIKKKKKWEKMFWYNKRGLLIQFLDDYSCYNLFIRNIRNIIFIIITKEFIM